MRPTPRTVFGITLRFRWARASQRPTFIFLPWTNPLGLRERSLQAREACYRSRLLLWIIHGEFLQLVLFDENRFVRRIEKGGGRFHPQAKLADRRFQGGLEKEWFTYKVDKWGIKTHKPYSPVWSPPENGRLCFEVRAQMENQLIVGMDGHATELALPGKNQWKAVTLSANDFMDAELKPLANWNGVKELRFDEAETLRPSRGSKAKPVGWAVSGEARLPSSETSAGWQSNPAALLFLV